MSYSAYALSQKGSIYLEIYLSNLVSLDSKYESTFDLNVTAG